MKFLMPTILLGILAVAGYVTAAPPSGSTCFEGYNPDAVANVCFSSTPGPTVTVPVPVSPTTFCVVGDVCVPFVDTTPGTGVPVTVPGGVVPDYVEVLSVGIHVPPNVPAPNSLSQALSGCLSVPPIGNVADDEAYARETGQCAAPALVNWAKGAF